jgi:hypothetical protein
MTETIAAICCPDVVSSVRATQMRYLFCSLILLADCIATAQGMPQELIGKWIVQRELPTRTISCWGEEDARAIIGSEIEYTSDSFRWKSTVVKHPAIEVRVVSAEQFERENSSPSVNGSQVSFRQLSINAPDAKQVSISHQPAEITNTTTEIPGDEVLLKNHDTIVFSVCNLYFEAKRLAPSDAEIREAIAKLGENTDEKGFTQFEILFENPRRSTELLVATLKPVRRGQYISGKHPQVVWNIRALRSLTGLEFRAPTHADLTADEAHFLDFNPKTEEVQFFGTWMSRDRVWVAPLDAQTAIINKWRKWFRGHGDNFKYVNDRNFDHWYF